MRKFFLTITISSLLVLAFTTAAFASHFDNPGDRKRPISGYDCISCHAGEEQHTTGPHGGYTTTTDKCQTCHDIHGGAQNAQLLAGATLTDACNECHDLTSTSSGPYNMSGMTNTDVKAAHRVVGVEVYGYQDTEGHNNLAVTQGAEIDIIPGGDSATGGDGTLDGSKQGKLSGTFFTCDSCHTPHGFNTVNPYLGESNVKRSVLNLAGGVTFKLNMTSRLLKQKPNNVSSSVYEYSSAWCATCHQGRTNSVTDIHNHPVDINAPAYILLSLAYDKGLFNKSYASKADAIADVTSDKTITIGPAEPADLKADPRSNQQYAMYQFEELGDSTVDRNTVDGFTALSNYPNGPACQQCHGNVRDVELPFTTGSNPLRGSFPHISTNPGLLVEQNDDFCTNCHGANDLP